MSRLNLTTPPKQECALCSKPECDCTPRLAPFNIYDYYNYGCGAFANIALALDFKRLLDKSSNGPARITDRHGEPVNLT